MTIVDWWSLHPYRPLSAFQCLRTAVSPVELTVLDPVQLGRLHKRPIEKPSGFSVFWQCDQLQFDVHLDHRLMFDRSFRSCRIFKMTLFGVKTETVYDHGLRIFPPIVAILQICFCLSVFVSLSRSHFNASSCDGSCLRGDGQHEAEKLQSAIQEALRSGLHAVCRNEQRAWLAMGGRQSGSKFCCVYPSRDGQLVSISPTASAWMIRLMGRIRCKCRACEGGQEGGGGGGASDQSWNDDHGGADLFGGARSRSKGKHQSLVRCCFGQPLCECCVDGGTVGA